MARALRIEGEGALYHVTARGDRREKIFSDDTDRQRLVDRLKSSVERYSVEIHAFVLMPNHFHLLARTREANLSRWMQWLLTCYTMDFNRRHGTPGHLFQGRFKAIMVEAQGYFATLSRYVHLNPVRGKTLGRGEIGERRERLRAWRWSSYRQFAGLEAASGWVREEETFGELGLEGSKDRRVRYRRFVEEGLLAEISDPMEAVAAQAILGSEGFIRRMKDRWRARSQETRREGVKGRSFLRAKERGEALLDEIASRTGRSKERLCARRERGDTARNEAMARLQSEAGWSLREIGDRMGGLTAEAVAQRIHRYRKQCVKP